MKKHKATVLFAVPSLQGGGSERVISILLQHLDRQKFAPMLIVLQKEGPYLKDIPPDVKIIDLRSKRLRDALFKLFKTIKTLNPDIVFSTLGHLNLYMALIKPVLGKHIKLVARESSIVSIRNKNNRYTFLFDRLYRMFYNKLDKIVAQSHYMKEDLCSHYHIFAHNIAVINNPVNIENIQQKMIAENRQIFEPDKVNLVAVGRLNPVKGFDLLITSLTDVPENYHLTIIGEGEEKEKLLALAKKLDLTHRVHFAGFLTNPFPYMHQADIFVLSSRYEGFPNVVLEANACGTPVVAFACPGGTAEIIEEGINGFLVACEDQQALAETLQKAANHTWHSEKIIEHIVSRYDVDKISREYETLMERLLT